MFAVGVPGYRLSSGPARSAELSIPGLHRACGNGDILELCALCAVTCRCASLRRTAAWPASLAHSTGSAARSLVSSTRSATAISWRARSVSGSTLSTAGLVPSLRSTTASIRRAWWHHTARPAGELGAGPIRLTRWVAGRRRGRGPARDGCARARRRSGREWSRALCAAGALSAIAWRRCS